MVLFASRGGDFATLFLIFLLCYAGYHLGMMIFFSDHYRQMKQHRHEMELMKAQKRNAQWGVLGTIVRFFLGR